MTDSTLPSMLLSRRQFLWLSLCTAASAAAGCAVNPVTGESQLMLVSREQEIAIDKENSPHQFSADYGRVQNDALVDYVNSHGQKLASLTHRPDMPYSIQPVNATYVNAYAFPGGSIGLTRGILLELDNEAELAALIGHELGHVNARHTASQMSKGLLAQAALAGVGVAVADEEYAPLISGLGGIGAGMLLAKYSRDNEREADALGMEYMVRAGYSPKGMIELQDMLRNLSKRQPNAIETMFSTHPMSQERYATAVDRAHSEYRRALSQPVYRERYLDKTVSLRRLAPMIKNLQTGQKHMAAKEYAQAEAQFRQALQKQPDDYAALVMMSECLLAQNKPKEAERFADKAKQAYPEEAKSRHYLGVSGLMQKDYDEAIQAFSAYERLLPGNPNTIFLKGLSLEGLGRKPQAAKEYTRYLNKVNRGKKANYAYSQLVEWGYVK